MIPRSTYRLQLTRDFPFSAAQAIIPYLADLGFSHVYASPITTARKGSSHGYDVVDPTRINPELGGDEGFRQLAAALRARGMGIIIDIVPNHMGVAGGENPYWNDVLRLGPDSPYARWFDIDWRGPLILPILGATLPEVVASGDLRLQEGQLVLYGEQALPLRPGSTGGDLHDLLDRQHYRLVHWRTANDSLNWRRFFSINDLAGLRIEDPHVFEDTHRLYFDLFREGLIDGVRIDHVDGLTDPAGYCRTLRARFDAIRDGEDRAYIVVEKILAADEALPADWGVDGTSGYDFMRDATALLHDPAGEEPLKALWQSFDPAHVDPLAVVTQARRDMLSWQFDAQLGACVAAFEALVAAERPAAPAMEAINPAMLRRAIERLLWVFPVYRTYHDGRAAPASDTAARDKAWEDVQPHLPPGEANVARLVLDWLSGDKQGDPTLVAQAVRRFQQLSAPIAAKGVEDTAFYRYAPLLSANDVGSAPEQFSISIDTFHRRASERGGLFPHAMLASATHDHKRGEDVRARLAVLSAVPDLWREAVARWIDREPDLLVHPADRYQILQTLIGVWPHEAGRPLADDFSGRIAAWLEKSLREGRLRSSWEAPDSDYEGRAQLLVERLLAAEDFRADMSAFLERIAPAAMANTLAQTALKFCVPGVPDTYQGCEAMDFSLVDPDNRRAVDYVARQAKLLDDEGADGRKIGLVHRLSALRNSAPALFAHGSYRPIPATGLRAGHILAFERRHEGKRLVCAVALRLGLPIVERGGMPDEPWWGDTRLEGEDDLPPARMFARDPYFVNLYE
ncbi:malto-oligosyltrehalose synthase [Sphingobium olei]|uniref:Malto-oligosyltrehalose synthase n=1 Tax=Sphingobium olei TaxID=420955 RepID=A0ABW3P6H8_9SPHN|nr:malto-oligosyltrehalose synthase [Sphingobium sp.]